MNDKEINASSQLVFYSQPNFSGVPNRVDHGQSGPIATDASLWQERSVSVMTSDTMRAYIWSDVNTGDPLKSYFGHVEEYVTRSIADLKQNYPNSQYTLQYLGLDHTLAVPILIKMLGSFSKEDTFAATAIVPYSTSVQTTLGVAGKTSAIGFIGNITGSTTYVSLTFGIWNVFTGRVNWTSQGSLIAFYDGSQLVLGGQTGLPEDWVFGTPVCQADGSWLITLHAGAVDQNMISTLVSDDTSIVDNGLDKATLTATVVDSVSGAVQAGVTVHWSTTLGNLSAASSVTNAAGQASVSLTANNVTGTAVVTASLGNQSSKTLNIAINDTTPTGRLLIMGARSSNRAYGEYIASRLVALDSTTLAAVTAEWSYAGQGAAASGSAFIDTHPGETLQVSAAGYGTVTLNVSNIIGTGGWYDENDDPGSHGAFSARKDAGDVVAWGQESRGGVQPATADNHDARILCASASATAAVRSDGSVFAWGEETSGGSVPGAIQSRHDIVDLRASRGTFILRGTSSPYIQAWGRGITSETDIVDLNVPGNIASMSDIQLINTTEDAVCVVNSAGRAYAWGDASCGGAMTSQIQSLSNIFACGSTRRAFAVLFNSGQVAAWGDALYGGDARTLSGYSDIVRLCGTESAFLALRSNGQIMAWGDGNKGGSIPSAYQGYADIVDIKSTYSAFAALRSNGQVICWGDEAHGGDSGAVSSLSDIVAITGTSWSFAALHRNGSVSAWGNQSYGGSTSAVSGSLNNVRAIYPNTRAFVALKADNTFIAWGDSVSGGDQSMIPGSLYGNISYEV